MEANHPDIQSLADAAEAFCAHWFHRNGHGQLRVAVGKPGCGKTHVGRKVWEWARAVSLSRWEQQPATDYIPSIVFTPWASVASPEKMSGAEFADWMAEIDSATMIVVDDIGTETDQYRTGVPTQRLCQLLNRCESKWLWLTTNKAPEHWAQAWDIRVEDRLLAGHVFTSSAPSYRSER